MGRPVWERGSKMKRVEKTIEITSIIILVLMTLSALLQVLFRYVLRISAAWTEEFARLFYTYMIFLMLPVLESQNKQLKVTYFFNKFPYILRLFIFFTTNLSCLLFLILFFIGGVRMIKASWDLTFASLRWLNAGVQYFPVVIGTPFAALFIVLRMVDYKNQVRLSDEYDLDLQEE